MINAPPTKRGGRARTRPASQSPTSPPLLSNNGADANFADSEAEKIVLGSLLAGRNGELPPAGFFFFAGHKIIYRAVAEMKAAGIPADIVTLTKHLRRIGKLEEVGGAFAITQLGTDYLKPPEIVQYELRQLRECYGKRRLKNLSERMQAGDVSPAGAQAELSEIVAAENLVDDLPTPCSIIALAEVDPAIFDADNLLGHRFLCTEGGMLEVGPSGIGKSSANVQQDISWSLGRPAFGICPSRPLRILTIQAENDDGDLAEMTRGICDHLNLSEEERKLVSERVIYIREKAVTGENFISLLRRLVKKYRPDIIRIDPLHAYAGGDVCDPAITTPFLRKGLNPILQEFRCAAIICHHTPKTTYRDTSKWNATDWMYAGAGNADVTNWARAILVIDATRIHGAFIFRAAKRGSRIGWADEDGHRVYDRLFCHHAGDAIFWRDATPDDMERVALTKAKRGEPLKTKEELKALVPLDEEIPKLALIQRANMKGFGVNHAERLLAALVADKELHEVRRPRKGTCPEVLITRREEALI